eukprot:34690_3
MDSVCCVCVLCVCVYRQKECDRCAKVKAFRPASNAEQELNAVLECTHIVLGSRTPRAGAINELMRKLSAILANPTDNAIWY